MCSGFAQFGVTAALADVASEFGQPADAAALAGQVGLSGTTLGIGLAIIRLASLGALPLSSLADRLGRRRTLLGVVAGGLGLTALAAFAPTYWWWVAIFAAGRPLLSATNGLAGLIAAEETRTSDRAKAVALIAAGYGLGAGLISFTRSALGPGFGFRGLFLLTLIPLLALPFLARVLREPVRFERLRTEAAGGRARTRTPVLGALAADVRGRLLLFALLYLAISFVTGPANTFLFLYTESVLGMSSTVTAVMVALAGPVGLAGLLLGRLLADRVGRRGTAGVTQALVALACVVTYSGSPPAAIAGYLLAILAGSTYAPATGAQAAELFPTSVRGSVAGWLTAAGVLGAVAGLVVFGLLADALGGFRQAAIVVAVPVVLTSALFWLLPETKDVDLEQADEGAV